jgi:hypothetical protein
MRAPLTAFGDLIKIAIGGRRSFLPAQNLTLRPERPQAPARRRYRRPAEPGGLSG